MKRAIAVIIGLALLVATGCSKPSGTYTRPTSQQPATTPSATAQKTPSPVGGNNDTVNISAEEFVKKVKTEKLLVIDVRTAEEFAQGHVVGAHLVPLQTIEEGIKKYAKDQEIYLICQTGNRSGQAYLILKKLGYTKLHNVIGGTVGYKANGGVLEF